MPTKHSRTATRARRTLRLETLENRVTPATFYVNTTLDDVTPNNGQFSLREAIDKANATPTADVIVLAGAVYKVSIENPAGTSEDLNASGDFDITAPLTIVGKGAGLTKVDAASLDRVFHVRGNADAPINVNFRGLTITGGGGEVFDGAGILMKHANVTLRGCVVTRNTAVWSGGGISNFTDHTPCNLTMIGSTVSYNRSQGGDGGGIYLDHAHGTLTARNSKIVQNRAGATGGGIAAITVNLARCTVRENYSELIGGGVSATNVTATDSTVVGNFAMKSGGGVYADTANLTRTLVTRNISNLEEGGGIHVQTADLTNCTVKLNRGRSGGGIWANSVTLIGTTVSLNTARGGSRSSDNTLINEGGGIFAVTADLWKSTVSGNSAGTFGGGIKADTAVLKASTVSGNTSSGDGGGIHAETATLTDSTVSGNVAAGGAIIGYYNGTISVVGGVGGGIRAGTYLFGSGTVNLTNCTISGNHATAYGGGVITHKGAFLNATIAENTGGGVSTGVSETLTVRNTIIALNLGIDAFGSFTSLGHNLIGISDGGNGFRDGVNGDIVGSADAPIDPLLGDLRFNGGPTQTHALLAGSPAINAGDNSVLTGISALTKDQRGTARRKGSFVDIGSFER